MKSFEYKGETFYDGDIVDVQRGLLSTRGEICIFESPSITSLYLLNNDSKFNGGSHVSEVMETKRKKGYKYAWWLKHTTGANQDFDTITKVKLNIDHYELI